MSDKVYEVKRAFSTDGKNYFTRASTQEELREIPSSKMSALVESGSVVVNTVDSKVLAAMEKEAAERAVPSAPNKRK